MTERKPLTLRPDLKKLREQRTLALERLANPAPAPEPLPPASPHPEHRHTPGTERSGRPDYAQRPERNARPDYKERSDRAERPSHAERPARPEHASAQQRPAARPPRPSTSVWTAETARTAPPVVPRRVAPNVQTNNPADGTRLNKRMAELGICSRREGDAWIEKGWVTVNGEVAVMGMLVQPTDKVEVSEAAKGQQKHLVTILLHKPMGFVSGQAEDGHQPAITLINPRTHWVEDGARIRFANHQLQGLAPAGRLDIDSVGLLVLTQDGRVARQLIGEDSEMEKEYLVRVTCSTPDGDIATNVQAVFPAEQLARLRHGLSLDGEPLKPAQVEWQNPEQLRFVLTQGKKRQIRRMCEQVGLKVVGLKRIRMGKITLGNLPVGQWRYLGAHERF
jgi:23S rRNA pseudouridine2604 synthase